MWFVNIVINKHVTAFAICVCECLQDHSLSCKRILTTFLEEGELWLATADKDLGDQDQDADTATFKGILTTEVYGQYWIYSRWAMSSLWMFGVSESFYFWKWFSVNHITESDNQLEQGKHTQ